MNNITVILKYGQLIKIYKELYICTYKDWTLKINNDGDKKDECFVYLYFKGIYLKSYLVKKAVLDLSNYDILPGIIEKENSTLL